MAQLYLLDGDIGTTPVNAMAASSYVYVAQRGGTPGKALPDFLDKVVKGTPAGSITSMSIFAHAAGGIVENFDKQRSEISVSGFILGEIAGDVNLYEFERLKKLFAKPRTHICNLLSCSQATSGPDYIDPAGWGTSGKNLELCKALAGYLNQYVRASDAPQKFDTRQGPLDKLMGEVNVDFGAWEGSVYLFSPDGAVKKDSPKGKF